jgi:hypothetical protein
MDRCDGAFEQLDAAIASAAPADRPGLVVALAARLAALGAGLATGDSPATTDLDDNLDVKEGARRVGVSLPYFYRHKWPFVRREGRKWIVSARGIATYLERR